MSASKSQDYAEPLVSIQRGPHRTNGQRQDFYGETTIVTPELESFMRQLCEMIDQHPEWAHQSQPERMENFLRAVQQL